MKAKVYLRPHFKVQGFINYNINSTECLVENACAKLHRYFDHWARLWC